MNPTLREVSLLLEQFQNAEWRDLYMRTERYSLFIAKPGGARNPMLGEPLAKAAAPIDVAAANTISAPHLATVSSLLAVGSDVQRGTVVGQIEVLGAREDIVSNTSGIVAEVLAPVGTLVEYETPLLRIV